MDITLVCHEVNTRHFPLEERYERLDVDYLKTPGLTANRSKILWGLLMLYFFNQMLLTLCDTQKAGVDNDTRLMYYNKVNMFPSSYQLSNKMGTGYGHQLYYPTVNEFVKFDGVVVGDIIHGRDERAAYRC